MKSIKFKTCIDNMINVVACSPTSLEVSVKRLDDKDCVVELDSFKEDNEEAKVEIMNTIVKIADAIGGDNLDFNI